MTREDEIRARWSDGCLWREDVDWLLAEVERLRGEHGGGWFWSQSEWADWSNSLANLLPEDYEDDVAQEAIIERALADLAKRAEQAEAAVERARALHRPHTYGNGRTVCHHCDTTLAANDEWPCPTLAALDGPGNPEAGGGLRHTHDADGIYANCPACGTVLDTATTPSEPEANDLTELLALARRIVAQTATTCTCPDEPHQNALHDLAHDVVALLAAPSEPEAEVCACGHPWHLHDPEAVPALCLLCGNVERCGSNIRAAIETLAAPKWRTNRGHEYETAAEAFAAGRNEVIDDLRAILATPSEPEATVVEAGTTLTEDEREALDGSLENSGCMGFLGDHPPLYAAVERILAARQADR